ncbi:succinate dehydrogenase cytochrome b subunit [Naumannella sp. ID2617S]|nr:succinate dehydrogenase cytochrome b subunit [Naumannella sp. ID2617S]
MRKFWMAVSGLVMIGYLLLHMYGNLKIFAGKVPGTDTYAFDEYAHHLRVIGEPILPYEGMLWIVRVVLLAAILVHMWSAFTLWSRDRKATGGAKRYANSRSIQRSYASYTMRWGGVVLLLFVIYHILNFTVVVIDTAPAATTPFVRVVQSFHNPLVLLSYAIAMIAVGLHVRHGFWSAFATLGANTSPKARATWNTVAILIALLLVVGFLSGPVAIALDWIKL